MTVNRWLKARNMQSFVMLSRHALWQLGHLTPCPCRKKPCSATPKILCYNAIFSSENKQNTQPNEQKILLLTIKIQIGSQVQPFPPEHNIHTTSPSLNISCVSIFCSNCSATLPPPLFRGSSPSHLRLPSPLHFSGCRQKTFFRLRVGSFIQTQMIISNSFLVP